MRKKKKKEDYVRPTPSFRVLNTYLPRNDLECIDSLEKVKLSSWGLNRKLSVVLSQIMKVEIGDIPKKVETEKKIDRKKMRIRRKRKKKKLSKDTQARLFAPIYKRNSLLPPISEYNNLTPKEITSFVQMRRNSREKRIVRKCARAKIYQKKVMSNLKESERKVKLSFMIIFCSRMRIFEEYLLERKLKILGERRRKNFEIVAKTIIKPYLVKRRSELWKSAFKRFKNYFTFSLLYLNVRKKRNAIQKISVFLRSFNGSNTFFIVLRSYVSKVKFIQRIWRKRMIVERSKIMLNFLKWTKLENEIIISKFPRELFLCFEEPKPRLEYSVKHSGSFTFVVPPTTWKMAILRKIISENRKKCSRLNEEELEDFEKEIVLIKDEELEKWLMNGFRRQKRIEIELRKFIFEEKNYDKICKRIQIEELSRSFTTKLVIDGFFRRTKYSVLMKLGRAKLRVIAIRRMKNIYDY